MGIIIGYLGRKTLKFAEKHNLIDHENLCVCSSSPHEGVLLKSAYSLGYGIGLVFFSLAAIGVLGSDDLLACFIVVSCERVDRLK